MAAGSCVLHRRLAVAGNPTEVRAAGDQRAHGVDVALAAVAVDDGLVQRGPAEPVDVVDVDPGPQQPADDVGMTALGRPDQAGSVVGIETGDVRAVREGQFEEIEIALAGGDQVGALHGGVLGVDVRAAAMSCVARATSLAQAASMSC